MAGLALQFSFLSPRLLMSVVPGYSQSSSPAPFGPSLPEHAVSISQLHIAFSPGPETFIMGLFLSPVSSKSYKRRQKGNLLENI